MYKGVAAFMAPKNNDMMFSIIDPEKWRRHQLDELDEEKPGIYL